MEYCLLNTPDEIVDFVNFVYQQNRVVCVDISGERYYPHTTYWTDSSSNRGDNDPDIKCDGYYGHLYKDSLFEQMEEYKNIIKDLDDNKESDVEYQEFVSKLLGTVKPASWNEVSHVFDFEGKLKYKSFKKIKMAHDLIVTNEMGCLNDDHRGSNHMAVDLDHLFDSEVIIKAGVYDVEEVMDIMWRIKGNKFDNNYEMFFTLNIENVEFHGGQWYINCGVDHGS
ncbi:MAG TPA: hypothetical protein PKD85_00920 [Saprospiraceae bacterium]|nr:hypothetical protein [Saprospiraceae bacterium]